MLRIVCCIKCSYSDFTHSRFTMFVAWNKTASKTDYYHSQAPPSQWDAWRRLGGWERANDESGTARKRRRKNRSRSLLEPDLCFLLLPVQAARNCCTLCMPTEIQTIYLKGVCKIAPLGNKIVLWNNGAVHRNRHVTVYLKKTIAETLCAKKLDNYFSIFAVWLLLTLVYYCRSGRDSCLMLLLAMQKCFVSLGMCQIPRRGCSLFEVVLIPSTSDFNNFSQLIDPIIISELKRTDMVYCFPHIHVFWVINKSYINWPINVKEHADCDREGACGRCKCSRAGASIDI